MEDLPDQIRRGHFRKNDFPFHRGPGALADLWHPFALLAVDPVQHRDAGPVAGYSRAQNPLSQTAVTRNRRFSRPYLPAAGGGATVSAVAPHHGCKRRSEYSKIPF